MPFLNCYSVPDGILQAKFSKTCQVLVTILASHAADGTPGLLRPVSFHKITNLIDITCNLVVLVLLYHCPITFCEDVLWDLYLHGTIDPWKQYLILMIFFCFCCHSYLPVCAGCLVFKKELSGQNHQQWQLSMDYLALWYIANQRYAMHARNFKSLKYC